MVTRVARWTGVAGVVLALACDRQEPSRDAAVEVPARQQRPESSVALPAPAIPAAPIHWNLGEVAAFFASREAMAVTPRPGVAGIAGANPHTRGLPSASYDVEGARMEVIIAADPVTATELARELWRSAAIVFTSNNLIVIASDSTAAVERIRRVLVADSSRSGRR